MTANALPKYDMSDNPTNCCPRFHPEQWDNLEVTWTNKPFVVGRTRSFLHIPLNMGGMMTRTMKTIQDAGAFAEDFVVLSNDPSPWRGEHYFAINKEIPGVEIAHLSGTYLTKVFEGPYRNMPKWAEELNRHVAGKNKTLTNLYFFYTTCPKCMKYYGKNYVVGFAQVG